MAEKVEKTYRVRELARMANSIAKLREAPKTRAKLAFELAPLVGAVTAEIRRFDEAQEGLRKALGELDEEKGGFSVLPENMAQFVEENTALLDAEVTISAVPVDVPANFELDGLAGVIADLPEFLKLKE